MKKHESSGIVFRRLIGFVVFVIFVFVANILVPYVNNQVYTDITHFLSSIIVLVLIMAFIGAINEIIWSTGFPFSLIAPITSAILSIFIILFFYKLWELINSYANLSVSLPMSIIYPAAFLIVLVFGYLRVLAEKANFKGRGKHEKGKMEEETKNHEKKSSHKSTKHESVSWEDVGEEFKFALYNLGSSLNRAFERHREKREKSDGRRKKKDNK